MRYTLLVVVGTPPLSMSFTIGRFGGRYEYVTSDQSKVDKIIKDKNSKLINKQEGISYYKGEKVGFVLIEETHPIFNIYMMDVIYRMSLNGPYNVNFYHEWNNVNEGIIQQYIIPLMQSEQAKELWYNQSMTDKERKMLMYATSILNFLKRDDIDPTHYADRLLDKAIDNAVDLGLADLNEAGDFVLID